MNECIYEALREVDDLVVDTPERERLWMALWTGITTRTRSGASPINSTVRVVVTNDYASVEVIAAWEWLLAHQAEARRMSAASLERMLRGVATRSHRGSARAAIADAVGGISGVPSGVSIRLQPFEGADSEWAS